MQLYDALFNIWASYRNMTNNKFARGHLPILGFAIFLLVPSLDIILKYFGIGGIVGYLLVALSALFFGFKFVRPAFISKVSDKQADILALLTLLAVIAFVSYMYPIANSGIYGGGSDANDALIIGASELINGRYPFYPATYLGNPIAPMPGSIIFAVPFVLIGLFSLQNIFWLSVFFLIVRNHLKSSVYALALLWLILLFCPSVLQNLVTGTDHISNTMYVLLAMWLMVKTIPNPKAPAWQKILPAILLGVGLSSRANFIFLVPLLFSILLQNTDWQTAIKYLAISGAACLLVTIPFWLYDPAGFTPFIVQSAKVKQFEGILPYAAVIVPLSGMLLAFALSTIKMKLDCTVLFRNCAIVQLYTVLLLSTLATIYDGRLNLFFGHIGYGLFSLFFGVFSGWIILRERGGEFENA